MIATLLQISYDCNLVGAIHERRAETPPDLDWPDLDWMLNLSRNQCGELETTFVSQCIKMAQTLATPEELEILERDPLELLNHDGFDLAKIHEDKTNDFHEKLISDYAKLKEENRKLKQEKDALVNLANNRYEELENLQATHDLAVDTLTDDIDRLRNETFISEEKLMQKIYIQEEEIHELKIKYSDNMMVSDVPVYLGAFSETCSMYLNSKRGS